MFSCQSQSPAGRQSSEEGDHERRDSKLSIDNADIAEDSSRNRIPSTVSLNGSADANEEPAEETLDEYIQPKASAEPKTVPAPSSRPGAADDDRGVGKKKAPPAGPPPMPRKARDVLASSVESADGGIAGPRRPSIDALLASGADEKRESKAHSSEDEEDKDFIRVSSFFCIHA